MSMTFFLLCYNKILLSFALEHKCMSWVKGFSHKYYKEISVWKLLCQIAVIHLTVNVISEEQSSSLWTSIKNGTPQYN